MYETNIKLKNKDFATRYKILANRGKVIFVYNFIEIVSSN